MDVLGEEPTLEVLNKHLGIVSKPKAKKRRAPKSEFDLEKIQENAANMGLEIDFNTDLHPDEPDFSENVYDFVVDNINKEKIELSTKKNKICVFAILQRFGKLKKMSDLTPQNIRAFDQWLRESSPRTDTTIRSYHTRLHTYVRKAYQLGYIDRDPYDQVTIPHGKSKERQPLTEEELTRLRNLDLPSKPKTMAKSRDLFIFSAYTGLAYADMQLFDFHTMTEKHGDLYYIDGSRLKTKTKFFTPIFAPAMRVLEKYHFHLPHICNQSYNLYLHRIQKLMKLRKPLTSHVARHSFATLALSHDVPIENVSRMLGHTDISTTKIYAKILKETIERHATKMAKDIL